MGLAKHILSVLRLFMNYSLLFILTNLLRSGHKKEEKAHSLYIYIYIYRIFSILYIEYIYI